MSIFTQFANSSTHLVAVAAGIILIAFLGFFWSSSTVHKYPLPPGPKRKPVVGNLLDLPPHGTQQELHWTKHKQLYGPISSLDVLGQRIIIINDAKIARDLLEKRATNYSHRPRMVFAGEMCGLTNGMILTQANDRFRSLRRIAHNQLGSLSSLQKWNEDLDVETHRYLYRLLEHPDRWMQNLRQEAGSMILKIVYGYNVEPHAEDALVNLGEQVMDVFIKAAVPGAWLVDMIPALQYLPDWLPGTAFKQTAKAFGQILDDGARIPYDFTRRQMENKSAPVSLVSESLRKLGSDAPVEEAELVMWAASSVYGGGSDTTVAQMEMFFLAMTKFPEVQRKAQAELDSVVGKRRLPQASDRPNLPYIDAVVKECLRWQPIVEVNIPHTSAEDDTYAGYFIPKRSMLLFNTAGVFHDEDVYSNSAELWPERFLQQSPEPDPSELVWGFGRRICPGRWLAMSNLWLQIARTLSCFDIMPIVGQEPVIEFTYGAVRRPMPFKADIKVRSPEQEELIRAISFPAEGDGKLL